MNKTASDILLEAASLLEENGRWYKGSFFKYKDKMCGMCAHGAIAYCSSPEIQDAVLSGKDAGYLYTLYSNTQHGQGSPARVAHNIANQIGLSPSYNDNPKTTKQDVINKLREAASSKQEVINKLREEASSL